jgi:hypothetical protein
MDIYTLSSDEVISLFKENPNGYHIILKHRHKHFYNQIMENFPGKSLAERLYRYCYNAAPTCLKCGSSSVGFLEFTTGFRIYCSRVCTGTSEANEIGRKNYLSDPNRREDQIRKSKDTCMARYGVEHWSSTDEGRTRNSEANRKFYRNLYPLEINGRTRKQYTAAARYLTNIVYNEHKSIIDPLNIRSKEWVVDHVYSINDGFMKDVPLDIICHWTNLKLIHKKENSSKGCRSDKTLDELYKDYANYADPTSSTPLPCS